MVLILCKSSNSVVKWHRHHYRHHLFVFHRKLLDPGLSSSSRKSMFLNLLYKSLKADIVLRRVKAFVKRLLQVSCEQTPAFACGALFLVSEVMKNKPGLKLLLQEEGVSLYPHNLHIVLFSQGFSIYIRRCHWRKCDSCGCNKNGVLR